MKSKRTFIILGIILLVGIIAVSTILVTSGSPAARASKEYDLGNKYLLEGKYEEAIVAFEKVIAIDPRSVNARMGLSEAYIQLGEFDNAEIRLREVLDIDAEYIDAYIKLADVIIKQGDLEGVIKLLEEAYNRIGDKKLADKLEEIRPKAPTASIESGTYEQPFEVELTSLQEGWKMYYTLDGTDPDNNSIVYESPIKIEEPKTVIKLMSISETGVSSKVAEYVYVLEGSMLEQTAAPKQNSNGTIEIIDVSPKKVTEGVGTTFFVTVQYNFSNTENCIIYVGANTMEATSFELHDEYILPDTSGTYTFKFSCVPIDWNDIPFGIFVNISEYPHPSKWSPLDSAEYTLEIMNSSEDTPETTPESSNVGLRQGEYIVVVRETVRYKYNLIDGVPQPMGISDKNGFNGIVSETIMAYMSNRQSADDEWSEWEVSPHYWAGIRCTDCGEENADGSMPEWYQMGFSHPWSGEWDDSPMIFYID